MALKTLDSIKKIKVDGFLTTSKHIFKEKKTETDLILPLLYANNTRRTVLRLYMKQELES